MDCCNPYSVCGGDAHFLMQCQATRLKNEVPNCHIGNYFLLLRGLINFKKLAKFYSIQLYFLLCGDYIETLHFPYPIFAYVLCESAAHKMYGEKNYSK